MKPTVIGSPPSQTALVPTEVGHQGRGSVSREIANRLREIDFARLTTGEISLLEQKTLEALHRSLDGFLSRITIAENPTIFRLLDELTGKVHEVDLEELSKRISEDTVGWKQRMIAMFQKNGVQKAKEASWEMLCRVAGEKTKTLLRAINDMESQMEREKQALQVEIAEMERLQVVYQEKYGDLAASALLLRVLLDREQAAFAATLPSTLPDPMDHFRREEMRNKLELLESRTLAVEGLLALLPADYAMVQAILNSAVHTLHETNVTTATRFASIKMTLVTIHAAMVTKNVQELEQKGRHLDADLAKVRGYLARTVAETAANAPGNNRESQAEDLLAIVTSTREIQRAVSSARESNRQKFDQVRSMLGQAFDMLTCKESDVVLLPKT